MATDLAPSQMDPFNAGYTTDSDNIFDRFLGPLPRMPRTSALQNRNVDKWVMPDGYVGESLFLQDFVEDWAFTADEQYMTQRILPWRITDQVSVQWEQFETNAHLLLPTPYLAPPTLVTQKRKFMKAKLIRLSLGAEFEHDFLRSPRGRSSFLAAVGQIMRAIQETGNVGGLRSLVHAHMYQHQWHAENGIPQDKLIERYLDQDVDRFALVQRTKNGLELLDMQITSEMHTYRGEADAFLIPEEVTIYVTGVPAHKTDFYIAGQEGPDRINGIGGLQPANAATQAVKRVESTRMVRQNPVYVVKARHVDGVDREQEDLLTHVRQIGEYFTMLDTCDNYDEYLSKHRTIMVYDEDEDEERCIDLATALKHCGIFDDQGNLIDVGGPQNRISQRDILQDFLTRPDGSSVATIEDIHPDYLTGKHLAAIGRTIVASRTARGQANVNESIPDSVGAPVERTADTSKVDTAFFKMLKGAVPNTHHAEIDAIISGPGSVLERGEAIYDSISAMADKRTPGLKFKSTPAVGMWYKERVAQYKEAIADQTERLRTTASGMGMAAVGQMEWETGTVQDNLDRQKRETAASRGRTAGIFQRHVDNLIATGANDTIVRAVMSYLKTPITYQAMDSLINADVMLPFNFLLLRPHQQYQMKAIIKCAQDGKTGYTFIGNSNMLIGHQTGLKMAQLNYTTHMRAVITQPKNVYVQQNVMCVGYEGGGGCRFWSPASYKQLDLENLRNSLISVVVPLAETHFPNRIDLTGRFHTAYNISLSQNARYTALHYSTAARYALLYGFGRAGQFSDVAHMVAGRHHRNRICYHGYQRNFNPATSQFDRVICNKGHWGDTARAGSRRARTGKLMELKSY